MDTKRLREIHAAGTEGKWESDGDAETWNGEEYASQWVDIDKQTRVFIPHDNTGAGMCQAMADAHLIVTAVNALPTLLDVIEKQSEAFEMVKWCCANEATMPNVRIKHALDTANRTLKRTKEMLDGMGEG